MFNNMLDHQSYQVIGGSAVNRANMNGGGSSVPGSISNNGGSGGTVSEYTQRTCHQDMVSLGNYQKMEREELHCERELEIIKMAALKNGTHGRNNLKRRT